MEVCTTTGILIKEKDNGKCMKIGKRPRNTMFINETQKHQFHQGRKAYNIRKRSMLPIGFSESIALNNFEQWIKARK